MNAKKPLAEQIFMYAKYLQQAQSFEQTNKIMIKLIGLKWGSKRGRREKLSATIN